MQLRDGTNTISDERFYHAMNKMRERHSDEYDAVHDGSGRSEEMPSQLEARQRREYTRMEDDRQNLSVAQWVRRYPDDSTKERVMRVPDRNNMARENSVSVAFTREELRDLNDRYFFAFDWQHDSSKPPSVTERELANRVLTKLGLAQDALEQRAPLHSAEVRDEQPQAQGSSFWARAKAFWQKEAAEGKELRAAEQHTDQVLRTEQQTQQTLGQ
jgi:hypothetical protein